MKSVVATVSGYHGTERFNLIKLIAKTGSSYVGAMGRSTTHLVCWRFEGKKYDIARDFGTIIISHRWFEDCLKKGKRLPEGPYTMRSGQDAGPVSLESTDAMDTLAKNKSLLSRERDMLFDRSNASNHSRPPETGASYTDWSISHLLNENPSSSRDTKMKSSKSGRKIRKAPKKDHRSSNEDDILTLNGLGLQLPEESSMRSYKCLRGHKRNLYDIDEREISAESARKKRHLKKQNTSVTLLNTVMLECNREDRLTESSASLDSIDSEPLDLSVQRNMITLSPRRETSESMPFNCDQSRIQGLEEVENNEDLERIITGNNSCNHVESRNEEIEESEDVEEKDSVPPQADVSCVICWTDFCSIRGVLPCGHRFCFSCIQGWADCMASKGKVSTCPLCKNSFTSIGKFEGATSPDQKIYSQTVPCGSSSKMDFRVFLHTDNENYRIPNSDRACYECENLEPEDLLVSCHICHRQRVHTCCLDPPMVPWTCIHCRDLRSLYNRFR